MKGKATSYEKLHRQAKGIERKLKSPISPEKKEMLGRVLGDIIKRKKAKRHGR